MKKGGAVHATGSTVHMVGEIIIANNTANDSGGGIYLFQSKLNCALECTFSGNIAMKSGGAIYAIASTVYADEKQEGVEIFTTRNYSCEFTTLITYISNNAQMGGALGFQNSMVVALTSTYLSSIQQRMVEQCISMTIQIQVHVPVHLI